MNARRETGRSAYPRYLKIWRAGRPDLQNQQIYFERRFYGRETTVSALNFQEFSSGRRVHSF